MNTTKRIISLILAVVTLMSVMGIAVNAANGGLTKTDYGYMVPTNANGTKTVSTVKLYGAEDYIDFYINSKHNNKYYFYMIYSDKNKNNLVEEGFFSIAQKGQYQATAQIKLKGNYKTGTYYGVTCAVGVTADYDTYISIPSMKEFKVAVDRTTAFAKQMVILKNVSNTINGPKITWTALSGASKYYIYRRPINGTTWTRVGTAGASATSFTDTSVKNKNCKFVYSVKAINKNGTASRYHYQGLTSLYAAAPTLTSVATVADNQIKLQWKNTSSSAYYDVYRKVSGQSNWVKIAGNYKKNYYLDKTAVSGVTYEYTVRANIKTVDGLARSAYRNNADKALLYLEAPTIFLIDNADGYPKLYWSSTDGASAYTVYRRAIDGSTGWTTIKKVSSKTLEYTDKTALSDGKYIYTVRAEGTKARGSYLTAGAPYAYLSKPELTPIVDYDTGEKTIKWKAVPGAQCYDVYSLKENGEVNCIVCENIKNLSVKVPDYGKKTTFVVVAKATYVDTMTNTPHNIESVFAKCDI